MLQVSFNFNPETNEVSDVKVISNTMPAKAPKKANKKSSSTSVITLTGSSLKLTAESLELLKVEAGQRVCVRFADNKVVIARPDIVGELNGGNLISKSLTVSCRGKASETIAAIGSEFTYSLESDGYLVLSTGESSQDSQQEDKPQEDKTESVLDNSDFILDLPVGEEIDFCFNI